MSDTIELELDLPAGVRERTEEARRVRAERAEKADQLERLLVEESIVEKFSYRDSMEGNLRKLSSSELKIIIYNPEILVQAGYVVNEHVVEFVLNMLLEKEFEVSNDKHRNLVFGALLAGALALTMAVAVVYVIYLLGGSADSEFGKILNLLTS